MTEACFLSCIEAGQSIEQGALTSEELVSSCLRRIERREPEVQAWVHIEADAALHQARRADSHPQRKPLAGIPVGIKDVIDTADMPTELGARAFAGRKPSRDAACVARLRDAGAIILGKTVTAELATYHPGKTRNPHDPGRTPGGSSSGSAASVADFHVPLAIGTQTVGSVVRPASFCGVLGFKPSFGRYDTEGVLETSRHLDTLGAFARRTEDLVALDELLSADGCDDAAASDPVVGICRGPVWSEALPIVRQAMEDTANALKALGIELREVEVPEEFHALQAAQKLIHQRDIFECFGTDVDRHPEGLSDDFKRLVADGAGVEDGTYEEALALQRGCKEKSSNLFSGTDMILTPGVRDVAPVGLHSTGDPVFCRLWTALGLPCLGFPAAWHGHLPVGLQFVGKAKSDRSMLGYSGRLLAALGVTSRISRHPTN